MNLHQYLARQLMLGTRKQFSRMQADFLQIQMQKGKQQMNSNSTDVNEQSGSPRDSRNPGLTSGTSAPSQVTVNVPAPQRGRDRTTSVDHPANLPQEQQ